MCFIFHTNHEPVAFIFECQYNRYVNKKKSLYKWSLLIASDWQHGARSGYKNSKQEGKSS